MDVITIAHKIQADIDNLRRLCTELDVLAENMSNALGEYDKALKTRILELKSDGQPTTLCEKIAKGDCHKQLIDKELAIALYKIQNTKIDCCRASLNGYQSINKNLDQV